MIKVEELFDVKYGLSLELNKLSNNERGINFVSRTAKNNGVSAKVDLIDGVEPIEAGVITVACGGSVMESFLQPSPFYSGRDIYFLKEIIPLSDMQKLYYCACLRSNKFRYNYGRQANKTLSTLLIPAPNEIPSWVNDKNIIIYEDFSKPFFLAKGTNFLNTSSWMSFKYSDIFMIKKGYYNKKPPICEDKSVIPFVGSSEFNNGITSYLTEEVIKRFDRNGKELPIDNIADRTFRGNCITVSNNGSVGECFYQPKTFTCSHDVNPLYLKNYEMNIYIAMFLCAIIKQEKYRWSYGRKWRPTRMKDSEISRPVTKNGNPDWLYMEEFIKKLPYSANLI